MATVSYLSVPHFSRNRQRRFREKWGTVAGGDLVATTCISEPGQARRKIYNQNAEFNKRIVHFQICKNHEKNLATCSSIFFRGFEDLIRVQVQRSAATHR